MADIGALVTNNGLANTISIIVIVGLVAVGRLIYKSAPKIGVALDRFIDAWRDIAKAIQGFAIAVDRNTEITDINYKHSEKVLKELQDVNNKFNAHDDNALAIKNQIEELVKMLKEERSLEEVLELLNYIVRKLEEDGTLKKR